MRTFTKILIWIVVAMAIVCGVVLAFFEPWSIPTDDVALDDSIEPTMSGGDLVLVSRSNGAANGALVRCADPDAPGRFVVGRVMAVAGDVVDFKGGSLQLGGKTPSAPYACDVAKVTMKNPASGDDEELNCFVEEFAGGTHESLRGKAIDADSHSEIATGTVFLVSDNRTLHLDSRDFGAVVPTTCQRIAFRVTSAGGSGDAKRRFTVLW
ncbi:hypothetical protein BH09MYX1_BH09MYX1_64060 [soil metagenome]